MGEMHEKITARKLCEMTATDADTMRMRFAKLRKAKPDVFPGAWRIDGELSKEQITALVAAGERKGGAIKESELSVFDLKSKVGEPNGGPSNVMAPETVAVGKKRTLSQRLVLAGVCILCATASVSNMLEVSLQIKEVLWVAVVLTAIFTVAPFAVFYADVPPGVSWFVSGLCIVYEVFCNSVGIYRGFANLGQGVPYEVWEPGGFIDSISRVTTFEARPCALTVSGAMAGIVASLFLVCLIELKK